MQHKLGVRSVYSLAAWCLAACCAVSALAREPFRFRDRDRVVLLGSTFVERMQDDGHLEAILSLAHADQRLTFRNLGWSGDTVWGESRALFGTPQDGFARLVKDVREAQPTVLTICYGANEAHAGADGLPRFTAGLEQLLDAFRDLQARIILIAPPRRGRPSPRLPDPGPFNESLRQYAGAIEDVALRRSAYFVDLSILDLSGKHEDELYAAEGIQFTSRGNLRMAQEICRGLGIEATWPAEGTDRLREAIRQKNVLYFHRYRPQNETYLFLFRKHEQGNNAVEIPQFDPLIADKEQEIARLCLELRQRR